MDKSQNNYADCKKPDQKENILYGSIHIQFYIIYNNSKQTSKLPGDGGWGGRVKEGLQRGRRRFGGMLVIFIILIVVMISQVYKSVQTYPIVCFLYV